jgi:hypothetical protein
MKKFAMSYIDTIAVIVIFTIATFVMVVHQYPLGELRYRFTPPNTIIMFLPYRATGIYIDTQNVSNATSSLDAALSQACTSASLDKECYKKIWVRFEILPVTKKSESLHSAEQSKYLEQRAE